MLTNIYSHIYIYTHCETTACFFSNSSSSQHPCHAYKVERSSSTLSRERRSRNRRRLYTYILKNENQNIYPRIITFISTVRCAFLFQCWRCCYYPGWRARTYVRWICWAEAKAAKCREAMELQPFSFSWLCHPDREYGTY